MLIFSVLFSSQMISDVKKAVVQGGFLSQIL